MAPPSGKDATFLKKILEHPLLYPDSFRTWVPDWLSLEGKLDAKQIFGYEQQRIRSASDVLTAQAVTSTAYSDPATVGPTLSDLSDGLYILIFGARITARGSGTEEGFVSPSLNGATATDADAAAGFFNHIHRATLVELRNKDVNEIVMKYKRVGGTSVTYGSRYLHAMKVIDADA